MSRSTALGGQPRLSWRQSDIEEILLFRGGRFTRVNLLLSFILALLLTAALYWALLFLAADSRITESLTRRGFVPYVIVHMSLWTLIALLIKRTKLQLQRQAIGYDVLPDDPTFVLSPKTAVHVLDNVYAICDDPRNFILFNRIVIALSNLRNLGRVTDVDDILRAQADHDFSAMETSYSMLNGFVWAIPVLGFIGTVQGLSGAIGGFGAVLGTGADLSQLKDSLMEVTAGLSVAFETTFQGLVAALVLQLLLAATKKAEEEFLDECTEYCVRHIVGRLRLLPFEMREDEPEVQHAASS